jgi:hypothetical protein
MIYVGLMDTAHFTFHAIGATDAEAREGIMRAWRKHVRENGGVDPKLFSAEDVQRHQRRGRAGVPGLRALREADPLTRGRPPNKGVAAEQEPIKKAKGEPT